MRIHFIAIGGAIMHSLAIELKKNGHIITGSDDIIYNPAKSNLLKNKILPNYIGWKESILNDRVDLVILGMHAKIDNPELIRAQKLNIPILSFPEYIYNYSAKKKRIVIAGSHGKTTITSMILHVLNDNDIDTDYLLGAKISSLPNLVKLTKSDSIIIEGDEYLSSPIDQRPKFMHYKPDILVVSGVSWDHVNVYPTFHSYKNSFKEILNSVTQNQGVIYYCKDDVFLSDFLNHNKYAQSYSAQSYKIHHETVYTTFDQKEIPLKIFGYHNLQNLEAAKLICLELGVSESSFYASIQKFSGANNRLTLIKKYKKTCSVYRDFAHSPSKALATINAVKDLFPHRYLIACFELNTFSSLNRDFLPNYFNSFKNADEVWIYIDTDKKIKSQDIIDEKTIHSSINHNNITVLKNKHELKTILSCFVPNENNLLMMSSGNFSGLKIVDYLH